MNTLMTASEVERAKKYSRICNRYLQLCNEFPKAKPHRIFDKIAREEDMTMPGIRNILVKNNLYTATTTK